MTLMSDFIAGRTPPELYETYLSPGLFEPWADILLEAAQPHGYCLDIASGTGVVSRKLAQHPGVTNVAAIDVADPMVAHARDITKAKGLSERIAYQAASALNLPFDDATFDAVTCQQGLQFFPDRVQALREAQRVAKPGSTIALMVWTAAADGNPIFAAFEEIVGRTFGEDLLPFGPFGFGDEMALRGVAEEAGMTIRTLERRSDINRLPDIASFVLFDLLFLGRPDADGNLQPVIAADDPEGDEPVRALIANMERALGDYVQPDGSLNAPMTTHLLIGEA